MNDRFKFRFYHYETETMYNVKALCFEGRPMVTVHYNPVLKFPLDSGELIQCTGIKDNNGKLVFEGDVVFVNGEKWRVIWSDEDCAFFFSNLKEVYHQPIFPDFYMMAGDFKVIGNVHENEELLK